MSVARNKCNIQTSIPGRKFTENPAPSLEKLLYSLLDFYIIRYNLIGKDTLHFDINPGVFFSE
jgi:hypothetical protein